MCGIVGYIGRDDAVDFLLPALKRLEYRGYDSAGTGDGQWPRPRIAPERRQDRQSGIRRRPEPPGGPPRHRAHPLGHARAAQRGERPSAHGLHRTPGSRAQRHHREPSRVAANAHGRRTRVPVGDRHRGVRAPGGALSGLRAATGRAPCRTDAAGIVCGGLHRARRAGHDRRAQGRRLAARARRRR